MFTNLNDFLATGIVPLIAGSEKLHVLFATYNEVDGYPSGAVQTNKEGLTIEVQSGKLRVSPIVVGALGATDRKLFELAKRAMLEQGSEAQADVEAAVKLDYQQETSLVAVVYASISAFEDAVAFAKKIKHEHPAAKIVITTCDCGLEEKGYRLDAMLKNGEIEAAVVHYRCGGYVMMHDILEAIMEAWQIKVAA